MVLDGRQTTGQRADDDPLGAGVQARRPSEFKVEFRPRSRPGYLGRRARQARRRQRGDKKGMEMTFHALRQSNRLARTVEMETDRRKVKKTQMLLKRGSGGLVARADVVVQLLNMGPPFWVANSAIC